MLGLGAEAGPWWRVILDRLYFVKPKDSAGLREPRPPPPLSPHSALLSSFRETQLRSS